MKAFDTENSVWARFSPEQRGQMEAYSVHYRQFLDTARTERLANKEIIRQAENAGFHPLADFTSLKAGDKVYWDQKGKSVILAVIGSSPIEKRTENRRLPYRLPAPGCQGHACRRKE